MDLPPLNLRRLIHETADALLSGVWEKDALNERTRAAFGLEASWIEALVSRIVEYFGALPPTRRSLIAYLARDEPFITVLKKTRPPALKRLLTSAPMQPPAGAPASWPVPPLTTEAALATWLDVSVEHLTWMADVHAREHSRSRGPLRHYVYKWIPKRTVGWRLLEIPKSKLKCIQRRILNGILDHVPPHESARGFRRGASILKFVEPHCAKACVLRMDLKDFFMSVRASRIHALFRTLGYPEPIARLLTGLCTNSVPSPEMRLPTQHLRLSGRQSMLLRTPHLPQGAPTSPALANLCAHGLDRRLAALAKKFAWSYTRYADDLLFSGPPLRREILDQLPIWIGAIATKEGFAVNTRKTRMAKKSARQHAGGLVLNQKPNIPREEFDTLKAMLHNCAKHGPASQNRASHPDFKAHLRGRISYVEQINPTHGGKLQRAFARIAW